MRAAIFTRQRSQPDEIFINSIINLMELRVRFRTHFSSVCCIPLRIRTIFRNDRTLHCLVSRKALRKVVIACFRSEKAFRNQHRHWLNCNFYCINIQLKWHVRALITLIDYAHRNVGHGACYIRVNKSY